MAGGENLDAERQLLSAAAAGDLQALRSLTLYVMAADDSDSPFGDTLAQAEIFARLAAERGGVEDKGTLLQIICNRAGLLAATAPKRAEELAVQAGLILDALERTKEGRVVAAECLTVFADAGADWAAVRLSSLMEAVPAAEAQRITAEVAPRMVQAEADIGELVRAINDNGRGA